MNITIKHIEYLKNDTIYYVYLDEDNNVPLVINRLDDLSIALREAGYILPEDN